MKFKYLIIIILFIIVVFFVSLIFSQHKKAERTHVKIPILLYHDFVTTVPDKDPDNFNYINTPQSFEENVKVLLENGYTIMSIQELANTNKEKAELSENPILITMDDGYYSNYEYVYPILKKYNVKASIFIVTDKIGKEIDGRKYLTWEQCAEMQNSGLVEIFSHSKMHVFYDKLPVRAIRDDVSASYKSIESHLGGKDLKVFAYPYGAYTRGTVWALKLNGIDMQIYDLGMNYFDEFNTDYIKRINVPCEMTGKEIIEEIQNTN